jgi:hypothetical protein
MPKCGLRFPQISVFPIFGSNLEIRQNSRNSQKNDQKNRNLYRFIHILEARPQKSSIFGRGRKKLRKIYEIKDVKCYVKYVFAPGPQKIFKTLCLSNLNQITKRRVATPVAFQHAVALTLNVYTPRAAHK